MNQKILIDVEEIAGVIKKHKHHKLDLKHCVPVIVVDLADLFERGSNTCINCGHQIWMKYGYGYVHKYLNVMDCSGDEREITKCSCSNPKPFNPKKFKELCGVEE